jgi:predicted amidohydrolase YtcJ
LEQFERLAQKLGIKLSPARIQHLNVLRDAGAIRSSDLPATMQAKFPGEFAGWTLSAIRKKCARK